MDLILKPTVNCNFKCTFCSSTHLSEESKDIVELSQIKEFIDRYKTNTIIVNGGDPLMMPPEYYWEIIKMLDESGQDTSISFTSNLWPFYKNPEKWEELFRHPRMGITTSFQYGNKRLKGDGSVYTEEDFWNVSDMFLERIGYRPDFIAVIDKDNVDSVMKTVELAKKMGVEAKINHVLASGKEVVKGGVTMGSENNFFTQADMYTHYIEIYEKGLMEWEYNTKQMAKILKGASTTCPLSRDCDSGIRTLQPGGGYYSCGAFADDGKYPIDFKIEMDGGFVTPLTQDISIDTMKQSCYSCPMFNICNGCKKTISDTKRMGLVEHQCRTMKSNAQKIIDINGMGDYMKPTPYINEEVDIIVKG